MRVSSFAARPGLGCVINYEAANLVIVVALARHGRQRSHCYLVPIYILVGATNDQRHCGMALASDLLSCILTVGLYFFAVWASSKVRDCFLSLRTTCGNRGARPRNRQGPRATAAIISELSLGSWPARMHDKPVELTKIHAVCIQKTV